MLLVLKGNDGQASCICRDEIDTLLFDIDKSTVEFEFRIVVVDRRCDLFQSVDKLMRIDGKTRFVLKGWKFRKLFGREGREFELGASLLDKECIT